jgi:ABC-2 type transport system permease protein
VTGAAREAAAVPRTLAAFAWRAVATRLSYRTQLSLGLASTVLSAVVLVFVGRVVAFAGAGFEARYGMTYTEFAVLGVVVHGAASAGLGAFRGAVRREQLQGTIEHLLLSRGPAPVLVLLSGAGGVLSAFLGGAVLLAACSWVGGFPLEMSGPFAAAVCLYAATMCGLGLASAGVVLVTKEGEPVSWLLSTLSALAGGVYFPPDLLPGWLRAVSGALPTTHVLAVVRGAATGGPGDARAPLLLLSATALAACLAGAATLRWGLSRARDAGTLGEY